MSGTPNQEQLEKAIDAIFNNYDKNKNGLLEVEEVTLLINDAMKHMSKNRTVTAQEVEQFITAIDSNKDRSINRQELLQVFMRLLDVGPKWLYLLHRIHIFI